MTDRQFQIAYVQEKNKWNGVAYLELAIGKFRRRHKHLYFGKIIFWKFSKHNKNYRVPRNAYKKN